MNKLILYGDPRDTEGLFRKISEDLKEVGIINFRDRSITVPEKVFIICISQREKLLGASRFGTVLIYRAISLDEFEFFMRKLYLVTASPHAAFQSIQLDSLKTNKE